MNVPNPLPYFAALFLLASPALAQEAPLSHTLDFPKGDAAWSVRIGKAAPPTPEPAAEANAPETADPPKDRDILQIDIVRKGGLRRDQVRWNDGSTTEYWWSTTSPVVVFQLKADEKVRAMKTTQMGARRFDAAIFDWIGASTFRKAETYRGKKCLYYNYELPLVDGDTMTIHAWLDLQTHRPWAWSDGDTLALFQFDQPVPEEPLGIPPTFASALREYEAYYAPPKRMGRR